MSSQMPDFKAMPRNDQVALGAGVLVFIASFFPWYGSSFVSITAWHSYSTLAVLLVLVGTAITAVVVFSIGTLPTLPVGPRTLAAALVGLGTLLELIRLLTLHHGDGVGIRWGGYILMILMLVASVVSALSARDEMSGSAGAPPTAPPI